MKAHSNEHENDKGTVGETAEALAERLGEYKDKAKELLHKANNTSLADVEKGIGSYVRENPGRSLLIAAVTGLAIGYMLRRR